MELGLRGENENVNVNVNANINGIGQGLRVSDDVKFSNGGTGNDEEMWLRGKFIKSILKINLNTQICADIPVTIINSERIPYELY